jgi:hypothetical protein
MLNALILLATTLACGARPCFQAQVAPVLPGWGGLPVPAAAMVTGDIQHQVQGPEGDDQRHGQHAQVLEGEHWPVQPVGQPVDGVEGGPLDGPDPPIGDDHRADREHRQAGHEQHDVAPNPVHGTSPPSPPLRSLGTRSQRRSSHHAASRLDLPTVRIPPEGSAREYLALPPSTSERSLGDNRSWRFSSRARRAVQAPLL